MLWECSYAGQVKDDETGELLMLDFENVREVFDQRIKEIEDECWSNEPSVLYFTGDERLVKSVNKQRKREGKELLEFKPNFRLGAAKTAPYKQRKNTRPLHYYNLRAYALQSYECKVAVGMEADDWLAIDQIENAKEYGVAIETHAGRVLVDYEDWLEYGHLTFIVDRKGYVVRDTGKGKTREVWSLHRKIMGDPQGKVVDHINGNKLDCRKYNLRECSVKENVRNCESRTGVSRYKGVVWDKSRHKWIAQIRKEGKNYFLGRFSSEEGAAKEYDRRVPEFFGEYARLNFQAPLTKPFKETIICSRDKDLRQVPLGFYSWECGAQPSFGPTKIDPVGELSLPKPNKLVGTGLKFFYAQMIMGDNVDTVPGLPRGGPTLAFKTLSELTTEEEMYGAVKTLYESRMGEDWEDYFQEQAALLWMVREIDEEGKPVPYRPPE